ncbi:MAG: APC family permease, partial [Myxococcota bacterium]
MRRGHEAPSGPDDAASEAVIEEKSTGLRRRLGLTGLAATGICSMLGAGINVVPFMIQRNVPGIGPHVLSAFALAAVPALLAAAAYAILASAMPRAGGSYVYASRGLQPYVGFVASFSQWFGLSIAIGVVAYVTVPFLRDVASALGAVEIAATLEHGPVRVGLALLLLWGSVFINVRGAQLYERVLIPMMLLMFILGAIVIVGGFAFSHDDFHRALAVRENVSTLPADTQFSWPVFLAAAAVLFSSFIGFDSIAQAGGEAKNPGTTLPLAIGIAIGVVGGYYLLFTAAVYHAVPWEFIAERAQTQDLTAPGLLGYLLPSHWTALIVFGAAVALANDLPAMLLAVSRLMFAWAEDGVFPSAVARIHPRY